MSSVMRFDQWQDSEGNTVYDGASGGLIVPGLVAVKHVLKTDTFSASVAAGGNVAVTDLSITHEVSDPANRLIISAFFGVAANSAGRGQVGIAVNNGTSFIGIGDTAGSRTEVSSGGDASGTTSSAVTTRPSMTFVYTPGSGSKTYSIHAFNVRSITETLYINRSTPDTDDVASARGVSSLVIQEVAV